MATARGHMSPSLPISDKTGIDSGKRAFDDEEVDLGDVISLRILLSRFGVVLRGGVVGNVGVG